MVLLIPLTLLILISDASRRRYFKLFSYSDISPSPVMGNQLVGIAPSQIYPVEHYIQDLPADLNLRYQSSLGSTRFFKVAKCDSDAGGVVVKVFVIHDPNHDIKTYQRRLRELRDVLTPTFNCLPFSAVVLTERAGFLIRQYGKYSLYDR